MDNQTPPLENDPSITFEEVTPNTYLATFTSFSTTDKRNAAQAEYYLQRLKELISEKPGRSINIINDTRAISNQVTKLSPRARKTYLAAYRLPEIDRVAMVGFGPWLKNFIYFLAQFAQRSSQTKFFETPDEALEWLNA